MCSSLCSKARKSQRFGCVQVSAPPSHSAPVQNLLGVAYMSAADSDEAVLVPSKHLLMPALVMMIVMAHSISTSPVVRKNRAGPKSVKTEISFDMFCLEQTKQYQNNTF